MERIWYLSGTPTFQYRFYDWEAQELFLQTSMVGFANSHILCLDIEADFQTFPDGSPNKVCLEELPRAPIWYDLRRYLHCRDSYTHELKLPSIRQC